MRIGLRTEIILSISLLLAAALLFAGFLLLKLTEFNLLQQQRRHADGMLRLIVAGLEENAVSQSVEEFNGIEYLHDVLGQQHGIIAWRILGLDLTSVAGVSYDVEPGFVELSPTALPRGEISEELFYQSHWLIGHSEESNRLNLSTVLWGNDQELGLLQVSFSLEELRHQIDETRRLMLIYVVLYGLVLAVFGVYLLNRNVVNPVRLLRSATTDVADGTLQPVQVASGPGEIHELADSFNQMIVALDESRQETEAHITSLEASNCALAKARDELVRSEKLATVGHLAAGMAHEIGNPLGAIIGYLNVLKTDLKGHDSCDLLERSLTESARIDKLVRELLEYSAPGNSCQESLDPIMLLRESVQMLQHQGHYDDIEIEDACERNPVTVVMDSARLMQVWVNLLLNARDAMGGAGRVRLSSDQNEETVSVKIRDYGEGLSVEAAKRVFEPFYTTKDPGKGYGLGLAVCQRIVDEQGGRICVDSVAGQETTFTVTLPCKESC
ncbi:MAG: ATP-binding protein [Desulfuromonadales bacterium]|nr:ATP-binding protein [Desulfuromonadales bacterium]